MCSKVLCFGELLIRFQSEFGTIFKDKKASLKGYPGGSEANVAISLARLEVPVTYLTAIPDNPLSTELQSILESHNVDTSKVLFQGDRIGSYYLFSANGLSDGDVLYDRKYSSFNRLKNGDIQWDEVFQDVDWFHFSALTPAIDNVLAELCLEGLKVAREKKITVSVDLNYRSKLWQYDKQPIEVMPEIVDYADVIMGNIWASNKMLGTTLLDNLDKNTSKELLVESSENSANEIFVRYKNCKYVANTFRFMAHSRHNRFFGTYHTRTETKVSQTMETEELIDRIGSGDAFMAGLIYGIREKLNPQEIIDLASLSGFQKLFVEGDF